MQRPWHERNVSGNQDIVAGALLARIRSALGDAAVVEGAEAREKAVGWSRLGAPHAILRPSSTEEVSSVLELCHDAAMPVVPWGGKTGLVDAGLADGAVALSLDRMARIEAVNAADGTMTVQAGCILQLACEAAEAEDMFLPLDLGARGSATIGGVISTNAGGNRVLRFGMMRDMVLGIEAVLADGTIVSSLNGLIKNNTGYDLKQLFIGAEGTLGIVTRAVLRLRPHWKSQNTALVALESFDEVVRLLRRLEGGLGGRLAAFEVMWSPFYELVTTPPALGRPILPHGHPFYVLVEALGGDPDRDKEAFEAILMGLVEDGGITDAVVAQSRGECDAMWALRDDGVQVTRNGPIASFDVSLKLSSIPDFERDLKQALGAAHPRSSLVLFGHIGDGNIHTVVGLTEDTPAMRKAVSTLVYEKLAAYQGSISAEHGIGLEKRDYLHLSRSPAEIALMRALKHALDPANLLNPGKLLPPAAPDGNALA